jgi:hypothetical protein
VVGGVHLECDDAVRASLGLLGAERPPISNITFVYGPCSGPDPNAVYDCAVQMFGTVTITFLDDAAQPVVVSVRRAAGGTAIAELQ